MKKLYSKTLKFSILLLLLSTVSSLEAQSFYDRTIVQKIEIFFGFSNWDTQLDNAYANDTYVMADSVLINGIKYDSVGVKYKGNSSYNASNNKNPLHIKLDEYINNQNIQGFKSLKLQNLYKDPSMIREVLSYQILEQYMDCPQSNFVNVYINGTLRGLYSSAESIDERFNGYHYYNSMDSYFKCNPIGGAGPGSTTSPDLKYIDSDSSSYFNGYEIQSDYGWNRLVNLTNTLNNDFTQIESILDVDRALWMLAFNNVLVNLDSYSGAFRQNYYLSWDLNNRFVPTVWDLNMSFGGFPGGTGSGTFTPASLDPLSNSTSANHPLIVKMMGNPMYKRMYMAHLRTIVQENFANANYETMANNLRTTIDASVQADPYKFYTYAQYQNSLTTAVSGGGGGGGGQSIPGIKALMDARVTFFNSNTEYNKVAPVITTHSVSNTSPSFGNSVFVTATVSNATIVYMGSRFDHTLKFNRVQMLDDGQHGDGAAGDNIYGAQLTLNASLCEYYFYAENNDAGVFSPQRAEHEYHTLSITVPFASQGKVLINEVLSSNGGYGYDYNGQSDDWVELFNTTSTDLNLGGLYLTDTPADLAKWSIPAGTTIPANGFLIIWADNDPSQLGLHTNFKLTSLGDNVILSDGVTVWDQWLLGPQTRDISYARCPDGGTDFQFITPTFNRTNNCTAGININELNALSIYPNPANDKIVILSEDETPMNLTVVDMQGRTIDAYSAVSNQHQIDISRWNSGCYLLNFTTENGINYSKKLIKQ